MRSRALSSPSFAASAFVAGLLATGCAALAPSPAVLFSGPCTAVGGASLVFGPSRGEAGPAFVIQPTRGAGDYDAQVNAVDATGRSGPDARGTVHLDASLRGGTLMTPDLQTPDGVTVHYHGAWRCASVQSAAPVIEPGGGPSSPR